MGGLLALILVADFHLSILQANTKLLPDTGLSRLQVLELPEIDEFVFFDDMLQNIISEHMPPKAIELKAFSRFTHGAFKSKLLVLLGLMLFINFVSDENAPGSHY